MRNKIIKQRINAAAWELKEFSAREIQYKLNSRPNMHGRKSTSYQVTIQRLTNLLRMNKNIKFIHHPTCLTKTGSWKWIGEEE